MYKKRTDQFKKEPAVFDYFGTDVCCSFLDEVFKTSRDLLAVDMFMKEPIQSVKRFCLEKIRLLYAEGSNA